MTTTTARKILKRDSKGDVICPVKDYGNFFDGTITKEDLRKLIKMTKLTKKEFWEKYLTEKCGTSTFKSWYLENDTKVPDLILMYLTGMYSELYRMYTDIHHYHK